MNTLMNLDPWSFLDEMFGTNNRAFQNIRARAAGRFPPVNVFLDDDALIIDLELPGKGPKDVALTLEPQAVVIADKPAEEIDKATGKAVEVPPAWSRRLELPYRINEDKASAKFENGILRIELPKAEAAGVRRIAIQG
jgi:HSP20 family protein